MKKLMFTVLTIFVALSLHAQDTWDDAKGEFLKDGNGMDTEKFCYPLNEEVPVIAYTHGFIEMRDGKVYGQDYCGLRDKLQHPRMWFENYGIRNYIYYTVKFE